MVYKPTNLSPAEREFLAEQTIITITPTIDLAPLSLLQGRVGPLNRLRRADVPLWVALLLKNQKKCTIVEPEWLTIPVLSAMVKEETLNEGFTELPFYFFEVADAILKYAGDDVRDARAVMGLVHDLAMYRQLKIKRGLELLGAPVIQMRNITCAEIAKIRPLFSAGSDIARRFQALQDLEPPVPPRQPPPK